LIAAELLLVALCAALLAPDTPIGKSLRVVLIDRPAKTLSHATPLKMIVGLIVFLALVAFILSAPELVAIIGLSDLSLYLDITIISILMNTAVRSKSVLAYAIRLVRGIAARTFRKGSGRGRATVFHTHAVPNRRRPTTKAVPNGAGLSHEYRRSTGRAFDHGSTSCVRLAVAESAASHISAIMTKPWKSSQSPPVSRHVMRPRLAL